MATYKQIQADVKSRYGRSVKTCWIAHVKELNGLRPRLAPNRASAKIRKVPCPVTIRPIIEDSMRGFGMI